MSSEVVTAVKNTEPTDANYGGWDILISLPTGPSGDPAWCCVAEIQSDIGKDVVVNVLETAHLALT